MKSNYHKTLIFLMFFLFILYFFVSMHMIKWMIMEFMTLIFVIYLNGNTKKMVSVMYYVVSVISGFMMIFALSCLHSFDYNKYLVSMLIFMSLFMKLGLFPFSSWMISIYKDMNWFEILLSSTIMKYIPMLMAFEFLNFTNVLYYIFIFNSLISSIYSFKKLCFKSIIACSSINHLSFFMIIGYLNKIMFYFLIFFYFLVLFSLIYMLKIEILEFKNIFLLDKILIFMVMLNYMMLPPFLSFMYKWIFLSLNLQFYCGASMFMFVFLFSSLLLFYNYFKLVEKSFLVNICHKYWYLHNVTLNLLFYHLLVIMLFYFMNLFIV